MGFKVFEDNLIRNVNIFATYYINKLEKIYHTTCRIILDNDGEVKKSNNIIMCNLAFLLGISII